MKAYTGIFTLRNKGTDYPARVRIFSTGTEEEDDLTLLDEPVTVTWDTTELTDVFHSSKMSVHVVASYDGQCRDIMSETGKIYGVLEYLDGQTWKALWKGVMAEMTWEEDFSQEKNYSMDITFSDFNYLDRLSFDDDFVLSASTIGGYVKSAISLISPDETSVTIIDKDLSMGDTAYGELGIIRQALSGRGLTVKEALEEILEPLHLHLIQHMGVFWLYSPDNSVLSSVSKPMFGSLSAEGNDATLESADVYRSAELTYDQGISAELASMTVDDDEISLPNPWAYMTARSSDGSLSLRYGYIICSNDRSYGMNKGAAYYSGEDKKEVFFILAACKFDFNAPYPYVTSPWTLPEGFTDPGLDRLPNDLSIPNAQMSFSVSPRSSSDEFPEIVSRIKVSAEVHLSYIEANPFPSTESYTPSYASIPVTIQLRPVGENYYLYWNGQEWSRSSGSVTIKTTDYVTGESFAEASCLVSSPTVAGTMTVIIQWSGIVMRKDDGTVNTSQAWWYFVRNIKVEVTNKEDSDITTEYNKETGDLGRSDGEEFSREFTFGTPRWITVGTVRQYVYSGKAGTTALERYMEFLKNNYGTTSPRRIISGTYSYDRLSGSLPVFTSASRPLATLGGGDMSFFHRSEEWNVRTGRSSLSIEEAYSPGIGGTAYQFLFSLPSSLVPAQQDPAEGESTDVSGIIFYGTEYISMSGSTLSLEKQDGQIYAVSKGGTLTFMSSGGYRIRSVTFLGLTGLNSPSDMKADSGTIGNDYSWSGSAETLVISVFGTVSMGFTICRIKIR